MIYDPRDIRVAAVAQVHIPGEVNPSVTFTLEYQKFSLPNPTHAFNVPGLPDSGYFVTIKETYILTGVINPGEYGLLSITNGELQMNGVRLAHATFNDIQCYPSGSVYVGLLVDAAADNISDELFRDRLYGQALTEALKEAFVNSGIPHFECLDAGRYRLEAATVLPELHYHLMGLNGEVFGSLGLAGGKLQFSVSPSREQEYDLTSDIETGMISRADGTEITPNYFTFFGRL